MITSGQLKRIAGEMNVNPNFAERDYLLGWFLNALSHRDFFVNLFAVKGGSGLRKFYFADHRFSQDLDFTARTTLEATTIANEIKAELEPVRRFLETEGGLQIAHDRTRIEIKNLTPEGFQLELRIYTNGPLRQRAPNLMIRFDANCGHGLVHAPEHRPIIHLYPDAETFRHPLSVYCLEELLAEKFLCLATRRKARDLYDLWAVLFREQENIDLHKVLAATSAKFAAVNKKAPQAHELFSPALFAAYQQRWSGELEDTVITRLPALRMAWGAVAQWYENAIETER
jgi:predicted nucleotidyltransferase component of viral defense system